MENISDYLYCILYTCISIHTQNIRFTCNTILSFYFIYIIFLYILFYILFYYIIANNLKNVITMLHALDIYSYSFYI